jgi:hypothetical protein
VERFELQRKWIFYSTFQIFLGPGGKKEAEVIGYGLGKLRSTQLDELEQAKKYAMDQSIKFVMEKQRQVHQQQVISLDVFAI